jgi:hypothetical protein
VPIELPELATPPPVALATTARAYLDQAQARAYLSTVGGVYLPIVLDWRSAQSFGQSMTTSDTFQNKVTLGPVTIAGKDEGDYALFVSYIWQISSTTADFNARVQQNAVTIGEEHRQMNLTAAASQRMFGMRFYQFTLGAGDFTWALDWRRVGGTPSQARIWNAIMALVRVA